MLHLTAYHRLYRAATILLTVPMNLSNNEVAFGAIFCLLKE